MLFDTHTNLMWYPEHLSDEFVEFAWEAKRAKMKLSSDVYFAGSDVKYANAFDSRPEQLLHATREADKVIVFGIVAPFCGINADQQLIAKFVSEHAGSIYWLVLGRSERSRLRQSIGILCESSGVSRPEMFTHLSELGPARPEAFAPVQKGRVTGNPGQYSPGNLIRSHRTAEVCESRATGRYRSGLPGPENCDRPYGTSLGKLNVSY